MSTPSYEPRVLVIGGNPLNWKTRDIPTRKDVMNGVEAWAFAFWGDYKGYGIVKDKDIAEYDIIIANTNIEFLREYLRLREKLPANSKWVALIEGSASDYLKPQLYIKDALDSAHAVNCINRHSLSFFRALTTSRVEYLGIPYPAENIRKFAVPYNLRKKEVLICPTLSTRLNDYLVARELGLEFYGFEKVLTRKLRALVHNYKNHRTFLNKYAVFDKVRGLYKDSSLQIKPMAPLENIFKITGSSLFWLNLDDRYTWGRSVLDAAALQIPVISTRSTGHAEEFFPEISVDDEFDFQNAVKIGKRLINDEEFYKSVTDIPLEKFEHLSHESMKKTMLSWL